MSLRPLLFIPHLPLGADGLNFLADFSAISACFDQFFPGVGFDSPHVNFHLVQEVVPVCL